MTNNISDNKKIAKNTVYLYLRMIVIMAITLFTSREILRILGVDDFGIYNVVAGVVVLLAFLQTGLTNAFQRYLSYDIGRGDAKQINRTFCMSVNTNICIAIIIILLAETVGLWFVYTKLAIPEDRMDTAIAVYHYSVFMFVFVILRTPYNSAIVSYEKMAFYAYISILEAILKLLIVYLLTISSIDRLYFYAFLLLIVSAVILIAYVYYVNRTFSTCKYNLVWDKKYFIELLGFSGWSMLGGVANVSAQQGGNVLLNLFSGLSANAAFGIANQVSHAVYAFSQNFQVAFNPQITKLYAVGDNKALYQLVFRSSLISYYMILVLALPFILEADFVLSLWLDTVPMYAVGFCILMTLYQLIDAFQAPLNALIYSTGKIKTYNIWLSAFIFLNIPVAYILLRMGLSAYIVLIVRFVINLITAFVRVFYMKSLMEFPLLDYFKTVVCRSVIVTIVVGVITYTLRPFFQHGLWAILLYIILVAVIIIACIACIGFSKSDRQIAFAYITKRFTNKHLS